MIRTPEKRDPRGYVIPSDQADFLTATKFVNVLIKTGVTVHRATGAFQVNGQSYPAGSYVVKTAQAFRPHVMDMFEPQDHPNDFAYPGGPPTPPYDNAAGYLLSHQVNDAFIATNRLLAGNEEIYWLKQSFNAGGKTWAPGTIFIPAKSSTVPKLQKLAEEFGLNFEATTSKPAGEAFRLRPLRIGLWDRYGGSMPSGWVRWLLEQYEFPFTVVYPQTLDAGDLAAKFDVLIFMGGAIPLREGGGGGGRGEGGGFGRMPNPEELPDEFRGWLGNVSVAKTVPQLRQ